MPQYRQAQRISIYLSMPSGEILTTDILRDAFKQGKRVFIPYTYKTTEQREGEPSSVMDMLKLASVQEFEALKPDKWGIPSLDAHSVPRRENCFGGMGESNGAVSGDGSTSRGLDLIVVPGQAFDTSMGRLGHGKGFYDFFFERCKQSSGKLGSKMPFLGRFANSFNLVFFLIGDLQLVSP